MLRREFDMVAHSFRPQKVVGFAVLFKRYQMGSERFWEDSLLTQQLNDKDGDIYK